MFGFSLFIAVVSAICFGAVSLGLLFRVDRMADRIDGIEYAISQHAQVLAELDYDANSTTKIVSRIVDRLTEIEDRAGIERGSLAPEFEPGDQHPFTADAYVTANEVPF